MAWLDMLLMEFMTDPSIKVYYDMLNWIRKGPRFTQAALNTSAKLSRVSTRAPSTPMPLARLIQSSSGRARSSSKGNFLDELIISRNHWYRSRDRLVAPGMTHTNEEFRAPPP